MKSCLIFINFLIVLCMYQEQYSPVFSNMVSKAKVLGVLSTQAQGDNNGALQVVIHISSEINSHFISTALFMSSILKILYSFFFSFL